MKKNRAIVLVCVFMLEKLLRILHPAVPRSVCVCLYNNVKVLLCESDYQGALSPRESLSF